MQLTQDVRSGPLEITDLLWCLDDDGERLPVVAEEAIALLAERGQRRAAAMVASMPTVAGRLDDAWVDALGIRVHCELQRLSEELQFGRRVAATLVRSLADLPRPARVVDVGCGLGFVLRSLAANGWLGDGVELVGVDLNPVLIHRAQELAADEGLPCRFVCEDALRSTVAVTEPARTVIISSGLLHHLSVAELESFFSAQAELGVVGYAHWDIAPCLWSTLGAWIFHQARMREPVSRHDGVLSARRAHPAQTLLAAADAAAPGYRHEVQEGQRWRPRTLDVLRPIVGVPR